MDGKVHRVTYNSKKEIAYIYLDDGSKKDVEMTENEWKNIINGDFKEEINKLVE